ncbi:multidrug effflux MFS transporter [Thiotrichales bacterium 19S3-7]|nr:multidrug effflux MFS transporter [Thiotrichales bacterium 19S3-7]MCF6802458.1 multidrug effflux MFS transporter [Thiotrichales bacterium 19S3-11]
MWDKSTKATLIILMPLVISIAISMDIFVPSIPEISTYFDSQPNIVQWTLSIYMLGAGIGQLISGPLTDRFGRRPSTLVGLVLYIFGTCICLFSPSIEVLIIGRLFQSLGSCVLVVVAYAIVRDIYSTEKGAIFYSLLGSITMIAPVLAPILGGYLSIIFASWRASFAFLLLFAIYSFVSSYLTISETLAPYNKITLNFRMLTTNYFQVVKNKNFLIHSVITLTSLIALFCFCAISPFLLMSELNLDKTAYGLCFGSNALTYIIASLLSNYLNKRLGTSKPIILGIVFTIIGSLYMLTANYYNGLSVANFMLPMLTLSFGLGLSFGPATAMALVDFSELAGTASALLTAIQFLGAGIVGSYILHYSVKTAIPFAIVMLLLSSLCLLLFSSMLYTKKSLLQQN